MSWADLGDDADRDYTIAKPPQKGEKMPTFEEWWTTTKFELGESPKSCAYRAWNAAIEHRGPPAASGERGLRLDDVIEIVQGELGDWGGPERELLTQRMNAIIAALQYKGKE